MNEWVQTCRSRWETLLSDLPHRHPLLNWQSQSCCSDGKIRPSHRMSSGMFRRRNADWCWQLASLCGGTQLLSSGQTCNRESIRSRRNPRGNVWNDPRIFEDKMKHSKSPHLLVTAMLKDVLCENDSHVFGRIACATQRIYQIVHLEKNGII